MKSLLVQEQWEMTSILLLDERRAGLLEQQWPDPTQDTPL